MGVSNYIGRSRLFWGQVYCWLLLRWLGSEPAEKPFIMAAALSGFAAAIFEEIDGQICGIYA